MDLQNVFYILGIICMTLTLVILISMVVVLFYMKNKITEIHHSVTTTLSSVQTTADHMSDIAGSFGVTVAGTAINTIKSLILNKKDTSEKKK